MWRINTSEKHLYLTFDDGPVPGPTEFVLDLLKKESIKATFFCIGHNVERYPALFERVLAEGHGIGNHTYDHVDGWKVSVSEYVGEVEKCGKLIYPASDPTARLFRPPYGRLTLPKARSLKDYKIVMWDVLTYDFNTRVAPADCLAGALKAARPGSIVVFHDSVKAGRNMEYVLPRFIDECRQRGYDFRRIGTSA